MTSKTKIAKCSLKGVENYADKAREKCEPSSNSYRVVNITAEASSGVATEVETPTGGPGKKGTFFR